jgi:hypothetical protein
MTDTIAHPHRDQVRVISGLNLLAGIWLFVSAFVVLAHTPLAVNNVICGVIVIVLAAIRFFAADAGDWISWVNALVGVWVVCSPWGVMGVVPGGPTPAMMVNNGLTGAAIVLFGLWSTMATATEFTPRLVLGRVPR